MVLEPFLIIIGKLEGLLEMNLVAGCEMQVAGCGVRVTSCVLRGTCCELGVFRIRNGECGMWNLKRINV